MSAPIKPYKTQETRGFLDTLVEDIKKNSEVGSDADLLLDYPVVYIHVWRSKYDIMNNKWSIYIGETNDIIERTKQHWNEAKIPANKRNAGNWQFHMLEDVDDKNKQVVPTMYIFGHKLFHKSLTLDIENRLIDYCLAMETAHTYNGRGNIQGNYCGDSNLDDIFSKIWKILKEDNPDLFLPEADIKKSAIYKASPNHTLFPDQKKAKQLIIDRTTDAILTGKTSQLVFVEGEAGTGKTVLTSSAFYGILENDLLKSLGLSCCMLVNHSEQLNVYQNMAKKLGYPEDKVLLPTTFLKKHLNATKKVDLVFVDEAHLLWDQNNQGYDTRFQESQLDEIMKRARVTVIMFDENQILHKGQITTMDYMVAKRDLAKSQGPNPTNGESNYIKLGIQRRMNCSELTMQWIDAFTKPNTKSDIKSNKLKELQLNSKYQDSKGYEIRLFDSPSALHDAIRAKASKKSTQLSRIIATYDWKYNNDKPAPAHQKYWQVDIDGWTLPWNEQIYHVDLEPKLNRRGKKIYDSLDWAEKDYTIDEAGSTFTIQGFDLDFAGVILGPSIRYDKNTKGIWFDERKRGWDGMTGFRILRNGQRINVTDIISQHELRVIMTRGTKGLYIYACDKNLRDELKKLIKH